MRAERTGSWRPWHLALALALTSALPAPARAADSPVPKAATAQSRLERGQQTAERLTGLPGLTNVGRVAPGIYRGAQPQAAGYATLKRMGIRTVINLRARHGEREAVEAAGMRYLEFPISITAAPSAATVRRVTAAMADPVNQPVFVHCAQGQDRTGVAIAVFRMESEGWTNAEAEAEMQAFGFNDIWVHLKRFVREYRVEGVPAGAQSPTERPATPGGDRR